jgi:hypothetical protein
MEKTLDVFEKLSTSPRTQNILQRKGVTQA